MKQLRTFGMVLTTIVAVGAVVLGVHAFADHYLYKPATDGAAKCSKHGQNHSVIMHGKAAMPSRVNAELCDTLTITNADDQIRLVAFGEHENHQAYDGVVERVLQKGQSLTVILNRAGTYRFHDHLDDSAQGTFTVN